MHACFSPTPDITWSMSGSDQQPLHGLRYKSSDYGTRFTIRKLLPSDGGQYVCTGTNAAGSFSNTINLRVLGQLSTVFFTNYYSSMLTSSMSAGSLVYSYVQRINCLLKNITRWPQLHVATPTKQIRVLIITITDLCVHVRMSHTGVYKRLPNDG
jgi:hypothetical protein